MQRKRDSNEKIRLEEELNSLSPIPKLQTSKSKQFIKNSNSMNVFDTLYHTKDIYMSKSLDRSLSMNKFRSNEMTFIPKINDYSELLADKRRKKIHENRIEYNNNSKFNSPSQVSQPKLPQQSLKQQITIDSTQTGHDDNSTSTIAASIRITEDDIIINTPKHITHFNESNILSTDESKDQFNNELLLKTQENTIESIENYLNNDNNNSENNENLTNMMKSLIIDNKTITIQNPSILQTNQKLDRYDLNFSNEIRSAYHNTYTTYNTKRSHSTGRSTPKATAQLFEDLYAVRIISFLFKYNFSLISIHFSYFFLLIVRS